MSGRKNLVMGLFSRMTFDQLEKFLGSLWRTTFHGDVCAFVDDVTPETVATLVAHGVLIARAYSSARPDCRRCRAGSSITSSSSPATPMSTSTSC
jgi:hypothetical protein